MTTCHPISLAVRSTAPTELQEPVTLDEAKRQCGVAEAVGYHDLDLRALITAARQQVESDTGVVCYTGTFTWKMTHFPAQDWFELPDRYPITSITSITYLDADGDSQALATTVYSLETSGVMQYVRLKYGQVWAVPRGDINNITVTFVAGYASVAAIPQQVKYAVRLKLHELWSLQNEMVTEATGLATAYERQLRQITRSTYA